MNFRSKLQYLLVHQLGISHQAAKEIISSGNVLLNTMPIADNLPIGPYDKVEWNGISIQNPDNYTYLAYYKAKGIECSLNPSVQDSLFHYLPKYAPELFYAGRLDKASEGLLLLLNDGFLYNKIISPENKMPKTYLVELEKPANSDFFENLSLGVSILGKITDPCLVEPITNTKFKITLTQGMNRQIRRMCFALGNYVIFLKRIQIGPIELGGLMPSEWRNLNDSELKILRK